MDIVWLSSSESSTSSARQMPMISEIRSFASRLASRSDWKAIFISLIWRTISVSMRLRSRSSALRLGSRSGSRLSLAPSRICRSVADRASW